MDFLVIKAGIIGFSESNGHPYSFSSIINGFSEEYYLKSEWNVILDYLKKQPESNFGFKNVKVTHAFTQDFKITQSICNCSFIENACKSIDELFDAVDAIIIARDDWQSHLELARDFLKRGIPVFIDKPLSLSFEEMKFFEKYIYNAKLMSCSGFRFCEELDNIRNDKSKIDDIFFITGNILNDLEKYGIHLIDALSGISNEFHSFYSVERTLTKHDQYHIKYKNGKEFMLNCLGDVKKIFNLKLIGNKNIIDLNLNNNFSAFRRTLKNFFYMIEHNVSPIDYSETYNIMNLLNYASKLEKGERKKF